MKKYIDKINLMLKQRTSTRTIKERLIPSKQEGQSREEYARQTAGLCLKYGIFALAAFALLRGVLVVTGANITVSNSVNGRELPIYCVETNEKKIALSFDAAWGNGNS